MADPPEAARFEECSSFPLHLQVQVTLKEMIEDVEYGPGDRIPSERQLSEQIGVSRMTVRRAVENLVRLGMLERRSTSGTYVRQPQVVRQVGSGSTMGLSQLLRQEGVDPGSRLLSFETMRAPRKIADHLDLRVGQFVVVTRRLRLVNGQPFCIETSYLPSALVPGLAAADLIDSSSLYELLRARYDIVIAKSEQALSISRATEDEAELLEIEVDSPVLFLRGVVTDADGLRVEYLKSVNHPDRVAFRTTGHF